MKIVTRLIDTLARASEESTLEDCRQIIAEAIDLTSSINDDIEGYKSRITVLEGDVASRDEEIARLKEANGRLFRERTIDKIDEIEEVEVNSDDKLIEELEAQINY